MEQVRQEGDAAVRQLTERFDKVNLDDICIPVQVSGASAAAVVLTRLCAAPAGGLNTKQDWAVLW